MGLIGGGSDKSAGFEQGESISGGGGNCKRVVDEEAGIVIYAVDAPNGYGVTAIPKSETDL